MAHCNIQGFHNNSWGALSNPFWAKHHMPMSAQIRKALGPASSCPESMDLCWFHLCSRLKVTVPCDSAWPRDSCCTLCSHWRPCCLSFLSHNLQMPPLPSRPPRAKPVNPHTPRTLLQYSVEGLEVEKIYKKRRKGERKIKKKWGRPKWAVEQKTENNLEW